MTQKNASRFPPTSSAFGPGVIDRVLSIVVASNLAVAQPLLDLLGRHAEFFVARRSPVLDLVLLAVGLTLVGPLVAAVLIEGVYRVHAGAGALVHTAALAGLTAAFALQMLDAAVDAPGLVLVGLAAAAGLGLALAFRARRGMRVAVRVASPIAAVVAGLFLFGSQVATLVSPERVATGTGAQVRDPAPVVMMIFDEFPLASLLDRAGEIDSALFPNFARLAQEGTWFRNATTSHDFTEFSVPAILTGRYTEKGSLPVLAEHPQNLFTLLGGRYHLEAVEPITDLCPKTECAEDEPRRVRALGRWRSLIEDVAIIGMHVILPDDLTRSLPRIDQTWGGFDGGAGGAAARATTSPKKAGDPNAQLRKRFHEAVDSDRERLFRRFVASIEPEEAPALWFMHIMLPHFPWEYFPDGRRYTAPPGLPGLGDKNTWTGDEWLVAQGYQRHLLQVAFLDRLLGELIAHLRNEGLYDRSLLVLTSDHGATFLPGSSRRTGTRRTLAQVAPVPLFVKTPHQRGGGPDDRPVESVDVLPTIADVLDVRGLWKTDGTSALAPGTRRTAKRLVTRSGTIEYPAAGREKAAEVRRKYELFASGGRSLDLFRFGPHRDLVGRRASRVRLRSAARVRLEDAAVYQDVEPEKIVPAYVRARVVGARPSSFFAVAVNGTIQAVGRSFRDGKETRLGVLLPPRAFRPGANTVRFFEVTPDGLREATAR